MQIRSFVDDASIDSWKFQKKTESEPIASHSTTQREPNISCSTNQIKRDESSTTFKLFVASVPNNYVLSLDGKSSATLKLVVASVTNEDLKGSTNGSLARFEQLPVGVSVAPTFFNSKISSIFQLVVAFVANYYKHNGVSRHPPTENGLRLFDKKDIKLIVDSEGAQFAPATLQVQVHNHQTDFQQAASHFNDGRLLNYSIVGFQVVELIQIPNSEAEGDRNVLKTTSLQVDCYLRLDKDIPYLSRRLHNIL